MNPFKILVTDKLGSFVRTGIASASGWLVGRGILSEGYGDVFTDTLSSASMELLGGLVLWGIAQASSLANKKGKK